MKKPVILVDMDDVMADFSTEWLNRYNQDYNDSITIEDFDTWNATQCVKPECGDKIFDYFKQPGIYRNLVPKPGSKEVLAELMERGAEIVIVTDSPKGCSYEDADWKGSNPTDDKRSWLMEHFPFIPRENVVITGKKWLVKGDVLIDDKPATIERFQELGLDIIAMDMPYNRNTHAHLRAMNWADIREILFSQFVVQEVKASS